MNKQRKVLITTTYNEMGIIIDTKAEEVTRPEPKWIPVSERLPEYDCEVLTYTDSGEYIVGCRYNEWGQDCWTTGAFGSGTYEAVAWMPLPEPYQEGETT